MLDWPTTWPRLLMAVAKPMVPPRVPRSAIVPFFQRNGSRVGIPVTRVRRRVAGRSHQSLGRGHSRRPVSPLPPEAGRRFHRSIGSHAPGPLASVAWTPGTLGSYEGRGDHEG